MTQKQNLQELTVPEIHAELKAVDRNVQALFDAVNSKDLKGSMLIIGHHQGRKFHECIVLSHTQPEVKRFLEDLHQNFYRQKLLLTKELEDREKQIPLGNPSGYIEDAAQISV